MVASLNLCCSLFAASPVWPTERNVFDPLPPYSAPLTAIASRDGLAARSPADPVPRAARGARPAGIDTLRAAVRERFASISDALAGVAAPPLANERHQAFVAAFEARMSDPIVGEDRAVGARVEPDVAPPESMLPMRVTGIRTAGTALAGEGDSRPARIRRAAAGVAIAPPDEEDLAADPEFPHSAHLDDLVGAVGTDPVAIFSWVHDSIEFTPTWGILQGPEGCARTRVCNAVDTASLLVAMLRIAGVPARYQQGIIEVPIERFRAWMGGFSDADAAAAYAASSGVPEVTRIVDAAGETVAVRLAHMWVRAWVDFVPSRGAKQGAGDTWVFLDPSFKETVRPEIRFDIARSVPFDRMAYLAEPNDPAPVDYQIRALAEHLESADAGVALDRLLAPPTIVPYGVPIFPATAPYAVSSATRPFAEVPDALRGRMTISIRRPGASADLLQHEISLAAAASRRLTLMYRPADEGEREIAQSFSGMYVVPPYLLEVTPQIFLDGTVVAAAGQVTMGSGVELAIRIELPGLGERTVHNRLRAGSVHAVVWAPARVTTEMLVATYSELAAADPRYGTLNIDNEDREAWVGGGLRNLGAYYFGQLDASVDAAAQAYGLARATTARLALVSAEVEVDELFGVPAALRARGLSIDVDLLEEVQLRLDDVPQSDVAFERIRGLESSYWEHRIFADGTSYRDVVEATSTVAGLRAALAAGVPIETVNAVNLDAFVATADLPPAVIEEVRNAVSGGYVVTAAGGPVTVGDWTGAAFIVEDPDTGSAAYRISGGLSGGYVAEEHRALVGGVQPAGIASRPSAIVAIGEIPCSERRCGIAHWFNLNPWDVSGTVGRLLFDAGYNTYVGQLRGDQHSWIATAGVPPHPDDIFTFIGHGCNGSLRVPVSREYPTATVDLQPNALALLRFRVALLAGCATGGQCASCDPQTLQQGAACLPNLGFQAAWRDALLSQSGITGLPHSGRAVVGQTTMATTAVWRSAATFWRQMLGGLSVALASDALPTGAYISGDENAYIR